MINWSDRNVEVSKLEIPTCSSEPQDIEFTDGGFESAETASIQDRNGS